MDTNGYKNFDQLFPLVNNLIDQATYFLGVKNVSKAKIIKDVSSPNGIIVNPIDIDRINLPPQLTIKDPVKLEIAMKEYLSVVCKMGRSHTDEDTDNCIFRVWPNATNSDFDNPDKLYQRYTAFIKDDTFKEYDDSSILGSLQADNQVYVQRFTEQNFLETPYTMRFNIQKNDLLFYLPTIRYGIENVNGKKTAYIYAIQMSKNCPRPENYNEYQKEIDRMLRQINSGVKENREVSPSAIAALSLFIGMLHRENITNIKVPDFLFGRWYAKFLNSKYSEEELDRIQYNLTNKLITNFLRLKDSFKNFNITAFPNDIDSFLHIITLIPCYSTDPLLEGLYELGLRENEKENTPRSK